MDRKKSRSSKIRTMNLKRERRNKMAMNYIAVLSDADENTEFKKKIYKSDYFFLEEEFIE